MNTPVIRVLSIEDEADIQLILKMSLERGGRFQVETASTGAEGIANAKSLQPDVIVLDYSLPDAEAPELITQLKSDAATKAIPIVILTARTVDLSKPDLMRRGAADVLFKPFLPDKIGGQLLHALDTSKSNANT